MDHDAVASTTAGPKSHRMADVRAASEEFVREALATMDEAIGTEPAYDSNESGHFTWDVSLLIRAAVLTWRVTGDVEQLRRAARWAQHVVERTDEARGLENWRGRIVPAWSSGPRYTAGTAVVGSIGGAPISVQAASERIVIERPSPTTAIIRSYRGDGGTWSSLEGSLDPARDDYLPDVLARRSSIHSVLIRGLPAPIDLSFIHAGEWHIEPQRGAHFVHSGMIARSLLSVAEELERSPETAGVSEVSAEELYNAARRALLLHDDEIRVRSGQTWYITLPAFPSRRLGLELPHNHVVDAATAFMILGRRYSDKGFRRLGSSLAHRFLSEIDAYESGNLKHPWYYYPVDSDAFAGVSRDEPLEERQIPPVQRAEDSSHATLRVRSLLEWRAIDPELVTDENLHTVALSFRRHYLAAHKRITTVRWLAQDPLDAPRLGRSDTYVGAWGALAPWESTIKRRINSMAYRHPPTEIFGATALSSAEILAMNSGIPTYASSDRSARE